jgi:hypothetical protein
MVGNIHDKHVRAYQRTRQQVDDSTSEQNGAFEMVLTREVESQLTTNGNVWKDLNGIPRCGNCTAPSYLFALGVIFNENTGEN